MHKFWMGILLVVTMACSGCVHIKSVLTVNADGSGELDVTQSMAKADYQMTQAMGGADAQGKDEFSADSVTASLASLGEGMAIKSHEKIDTEDRIGYHAVITVADVNKLKGFMPATGGMESSSDASVTFVKNEKGDGGLLTVTPRVEDAGETPTETATETPAPVGDSHAAEAQDEAGSADSAGNTAETAGGQDGSSGAGGAGQDGQTGQPDPAQAQADAMKAMMMPYLQKLNMQIKIVINGTVSNTTAQARQDNEFVLLDMDGAKVDWTKVDMADETADQREALKAYCPNYDTFTVEFTKP